MKFKKGETVLVLRKAESEEGRWENSWMEEMDKSIGKKFLVLEDHDGYGVCLEDGIGDFDYPRHVLKKIKKTGGGKKK